jgi:methionyl-tRNA formyltransferase
MGKSLFIGSKLLGLRCLLAMEHAVPDSVCAVVTLDDRADARSAYERFQIFTNGRMPLHTLWQQNELGPLLKEYSPDLVFVCGWYRMIPEALLSVPPLGFAGIHFSLLPRYRGGAPVVWSMINGERETGYSLFRLDSGMDTGPLYAQGRVIIGGDEYVGEVLARVEEAALHCLEGKFPAIVNGTAVLTAQSGEEASYAAQRLPDDGEIDWHWPQRQIYDFIRAQSRPYPGAYTLLDGKKLHIWRASFIEYIYYGTPGQIAAFDGDRAIVICGNNKALSIQETSFDGILCSPKNAFKNISRRLSMQYKRDNELIFKREEE